MATFDSVNEGLNFSIKARITSATSTPTGLLGKSGADPSAKTSIEVDRKSKGAETPGLESVEPPLFDEGEEDGEEDEEEDEEVEDDAVTLNRLQRATILSTKSPSSCLARGTGICNVCASLDSR